MLPPAPDLFSTTTGTPSFTCRCCCRIRASRSAEPPAANGTTMVTCRAGQASWATTGAVIRTVPAMQAAKILRMGSPSRLVDQSGMDHRLAHRGLGLVGERDHRQPYRLRAFSKQRKRILGRRRIGLQEQGGVQRHQLVLILERAGI